MKKLLVVLLSVAMMLTFTACNRNGKAEIYCWSCGKGVSKENVFCNHCGVAINEKSSTTTGSLTETTTASTTTGENTSTTQLSSTTTASTTTKPSTSRTTITTRTSTTTTITTTSTTTTTRTTTVSTTAAHTHVYTKQTVEGSCTEQGYTKYICSCGDNYISDYTQVKHAYSKYVCTKCGEIDKSHAYEYLEEWVRQHGDVNGTSVFYEYWEGDIRYSLTYSAQYDHLYISSSTFIDEAFLYADLDLDDYCYFVSWEDYETIDILGYVSAGGFTNNSPITYEEYHGNESVKYDFIEFARLSVYQLLDQLEWMLYDSNVGITLFDLGFTSYVI